MVNDDAAEKRSIKKVKTIVREIIKVNNNNKNNNIDIKASKKDHLMTDKDRVVLSCQ